MPRHCIVPGCKSNYNSTIRKMGSVSTFTFPKIPELRRAWIDAIPRKGWEPTPSSAVCILHFAEEDIVFQQPYLDPCGRLQDIPMRQPRLARGAVPVDFEPGHLQKCKVRKRAISEIDTDDIIHSYKHFLTQFQSRLYLHNWDFKVASDCIYFYILNVDNMASDFGIKSYFVINDKLEIKVFLGMKELCKSDLRMVFPDHVEMVLWSQIESMFVILKDV